jgi:FAD/FMN-containing dehydrogenase
MLRTLAAAAAVGLAALGGRVSANALEAKAAVDNCLAAAKVPVDTPGTDDWKMDAAPFNIRTPFKPMSIAVPTTPEHVQAAVVCGARSGVKVTAKCGGHSYTNFGFGGEDGHLMLEMDRMHNVTLDPATGLATVQGGSRLGHVAFELWNQGKRAISHGTCPG